MDYDGAEHFRILESFHLPSACRPLNPPLPPKEAALVQGRVLPIQSLGPLEPQAHAKTKDENTVSTLQSGIVAIHAEVVPEDEAVNDFHSKTTGTKVKTLFSRLGKLLSGPNLARKA